MQEVPGDAARFRLGGVQGDLGGFPAGNGATRLLGGCLSGRDDGGHFRAQPRKPLAVRMIDALGEAGKMGELVLRQNQSGRIAAQISGMPQRLDLGFQDGLGRSEFGAEARLRLDGRCPSSIGDIICPIRCDIDLPS